MNEPTLEPEYMAFKDGVYDAIIHGSMNATRWEKVDVERHGHYYKRGYDFGMTIFSDLMESSLGYRPLEEEE